MKIYLTLLFLFFLCFTSWAQTLQEGILDARSYDFEKSGMLSLEGNVRFYWNEHVSPLDAFSREDNFLTMPGHWEFHSDGKYPGIGIGTYAFQILLPPSDEPWFLYVGDVSSSYNLFINGKLIHSQGKISQQKENGIPWVEPQYLFLGHQEELLEIVIQVSNFYHREGGIWYLWYLGSESIAEEWYRKTFSLDLIIIGFLTSIGLVFTLISLLNRNYSSLFFGLFCLVLAIRTGLTNNRELYDSLQMISWPFLHRLEYICMYSAFLFFTQFTCVLFSFIPSFFRKISLFIALFFIGTLFLPIKIYTGFLIVFHITTVLIALTIVISLIRHFREDRKRISFFLMAFLLFFIGLLHDYALVTFFIPGQQIVSYSLILFVIIQMGILSSRIVGTFLAVQNLTIHLESLNRAFLNFLPHSFMKYLEKGSANDIKLGDHVSKKLYLLFIDIRSFTEIAERLNPEETFSLLNSYWEKIGPHIRKHGGWVERYIGDAILALFAIDPQEVLNAAIDIQKEIREMNSGEMGHELKMGISLHYGSLILGMVGDEKRMQATVIGDPTTVATQIEGYSKVFGTDILMSEDFFLTLQDPTKLNYLFLGQVFIPGQKKEIGLYGVYDKSFDKELPKRNIVKGYFERGLLKFHQQQFKQAIKYFDETLKIIPDHKTAILYRNYSLKQQDEGVRKDWSGTITMEY
ncbi:MAG: hypothetical protein JEY91_13050 [Spirochaetaceae bacterium]|nr:hypothetical protein [Spirochaetaceae bacterium]